MAKGYSVSLELSPVDSRPGEEREERVGSPVEVHLEGGDWVVARLRGQGQVASLSAYGVDPDPDPVEESERMRSPGVGFFAAVVLLGLMVGYIVLATPSRPVR